MRGGTSKRLEGVWLSLGVAFGCASEGTHENAALDAAIAAPQGDLVAADAEVAYWQPPVVTLPPSEANETVRLSQLGLYQDLAQKRIAPDLIPFAPNYALWSDDAVKQRWLRLPPGTQVDASDMDHWQFPVGTMLFKEFARDGKRLETRVVVRTGSAPDDTWMGAFLWDESEADAVLVRDGATDVRNTDHDVPAQKRCPTCHNGEPGRVLGFSAVQLPTALTAGLCSAPTPPYQVPGDGVAAAALGYLHANCGHCHNPRGSARPDTDMNLRLGLSDTQVETTTIYRSTVGQRLQYFASAPLTLRVAAGAPAQSGLLFRMTQRGPKTQMPPFATEHVDSGGVGLVRDWISSLVAPSL